MRVYLALSARRARERLAPLLFEAAHRAIGEAFPVPGDVVSADSWTAPGGGAALLGWSNEPDREPLPGILTGRPDRVLGYCGYLTDPERDADALLAKDDLGDVTAELGGVFSAFRAGDDGVTAATAIARVCPVYHAETRGVRIAGSRALLVHLVARALETGLVDPSVDLAVEALHPIVRHGFFTNDDTPFRGVTALPAATVFEAVPGEPTVIRRLPVPRTGPAPRDAAGRAKAVRPLAESLIAAAAPLARHREPVTLSLSGGRDSRLMAAALAAAGVRFSASTHGFPDEPDVILGARVAAALGIEHRVNLTVPQPSRDTVAVPHPLGRAHHVVRMCEGMNSAYELVNAYRPYSLVPQTSGSGGETFRGGFLYDQDDISADGLLARVRLIFRTAEPIMTPEANALAAAEHARWAGRAERDGFDVLDKLYLYYRTGRWIVGSHSAVLMNSPYYHPFFDNRVVRDVLSLPASWRRSEEPFFLLLRELAPALVQIPPEGKRWRFDRERRRPLLAGRRAWQARAALPARGRTASFNWRLSGDEAFRRIFTEQIMDGPATLFELVDRQAIADVLADTTGRRWSKQIWHAYTLSVLLSGAWRGPAPKLSPVRIPIPAA
ncbi:asparagine synthase-related protein [Actinomadura sp. KC216]|uniref:asparagine synthase-related protein n=1 Tax=Actinomadura sp. KC216 TaxID=2530370 RepID=UPI00140555FE|nr:asparagine synthase-related protein [Actinomadura sp. KC216]